MSVESEGGTPRALKLQSGRIEVAEILDVWLVEDDWWRKPLARRYVRLALADGRVLTLFEDLVDGGWYTQRYRHPAIGNRQSGTTERHSKFGSRRSGSRGTR